MAGDEVTRNLQGMDELDFNGWNRADWHGAFAHSHTDDVVVEVKGQRITRGIQEHIEAMEALVESTGGTPIQVASTRRNSHRCSSPGWTARWLTVTLNSLPAS